MDNLAPGFPTQMFVATMRDTIGSKPQQWVACRDIGIFVGFAFEEPDRFNHRAIGLAGDEVTQQQFSDVFEEKTGSRLDGTYWFLGRFLKFMVGELGLMIDWFGSEGYKANIPELRKMHPGMLDLGSWIEKESAFPKKT
jgi:hypothetical protein